MQRWGSGAGRTLIPITPLPLLLEPVNIFLCLLQTSSSKSRPVVSFDANPADLQIVFFHMHGSYRYQVGAIGCISDNCVQAGYGFFELLAVVLLSSHFPISVVNLHGALVDCLVLGVFVPMVDEFQEFYFVLFVVPSSPFFTEEGCSIPHFGPKKLLLRLYLVFRYYF